MSKPKSARSGRFPPRPRGSYSRHVDVRSVRQRFLIVCEGQKTEPRYFEAFRAPGCVIDVTGAGMNTVSLVNRAIKLKDKAIADQETYDQVWVVFDCDDYTHDQIQQAVASARREGIQCAVSNTAFELWYLLHFSFHNTAIDRAAYPGKMTGCLGYPYQKDADLFDTLFARQDTAIRHAERLLAVYDDPGNHKSNNPSTTVHMLVKALNQFTT